MDKKLLEKLPENVRIRLFEINPKLEELEKIKHELHALEMEEMAAKHKELREEAERRVKAQNKPRITTANTGPFPMATGGYN
uniref:Uncharacterized protein n=1 Tax=viral metagenome TaxID=1070528 RepID=A0A6H1ZC74_9ZZZZ